VLFGVGDETVSFPAVPDEASLGLLGSEFNKLPAGVDISVSSSVVPDVPYCWVPSSVVPADFLQDIVVNNSAANAVLNKSLLFISFNFILKRKKNLQHGGAGFSNQN
jgi:hypothetical protein